MPMLNYLGNGSMPAGVPGAPTNPLTSRVGALPPTLSGPGPGAPSPAPVPPLHPAAAAALSALHGAIRGMPVPGVNPRTPPQPGTYSPPAPEPHPSDHRYTTTTQSDGSLLLHLLLPGGKIGPVVKVIPAPNVPDNIKQ